MMDPALNNSVAAVTAIVLMQQVHESNYPTQLLLVVSDSILSFPRHHTTIYVLWP